MFALIVPVNFITLCPRVAPVDPSETDSVVGVDVTDCSIDYGTKLVNELQLPIDKEPFTPGASKFFKTIYQQPDRVNRHKGLSGTGAK